MKRIFTFLFCLLLCGLLVSQSLWAAVPTASFRFSPTTPAVNQKVTFSDTSTNAPTTWSWTFGDGGTSTLKNPSHTFATVGSFKVTLKASNASGSHTMSQTVIVRIIPKASFTFSPSAPVTGQSVTFTDTSTGTPTTWSWTFGDGGSSTLKNPTHTFNTVGSFKVTLKVTNVLGSNTVINTVIVKAAGSVPKASFTFSPEAPVLSKAVVFTDTSTGNPTAWSWTFGDNTSSTSQKPSHTYSKTGTFTVTLKVTNNYGSNTVSRTLVVSANAFNMTQTLSDGAQRTTLAFAGLAMITGNLEAQSFFPPGKVADYTGFQYLRDNDPDNMGHNTSFLTRVANNVIYILNDSQFAQLKTLAIAQMEQISLYGYKRFALMKAFRRVLERDYPAGSTGLNLNAVKLASRELYLLDGQISFDRALLYATILKSMTTTQKAYLDAMKGKGWNSWPNITSDQVKSKMSGLPQGTSVAVMTYASDLFSWYAGSLEADVYFCPERHGTYFGSFYVKDAPAIGHEGYGINEQLTATAGAALCDSSKGYVTTEQATILANLVTTQKNNLYAGTTNIVKIRTEIATLLRSLLVSTTSSASIQTQVLQLSEVYGDLDGANNYAYANAFAQVYDTLTTDQKTKLMTLRQAIMSGTYADGTPFDYTICTAPFLYSSVITNLELLVPYMGNTDYLF